MNATVFLLRKTLKNALKQLVKKPAALIIYALMAGGIIFSIVTAINSGNTPPSPRNLDVYSAFCLGMFAFIFVMIIAVGLKRGSAIFSLSDVNLLFTSPVNPRTILVYCMLRQAGTFIFASVFLIAQYPNIRLNFGLGSRALLGFMAAYVLTGILSQVLCADIYAYCAASPNRRKFINNSLKLAGIALCAALVFIAIKSNDLLSAARSLFGANWWNWVPVIGWARGIVYYSAHNDWSTAGVFACLMLIGIGLCALWLMRSSSDYYEDVLISAENADAIKKAAKGGRTVGFGETSTRIKREAGPIKGKGAFVFAGKALREQNRSGFGFMDVASIAAVASPVVGFFATKASGSLGLMPSLYAGAYLLLFLCAKGAHTTELSRPYVYLAPASAFKKLLALNLPSVLKYFIDGLLFALVSALLMKNMSFAVLAAGLAYASIGVLYASSMVLVQRLFGGMQNKVVIVFLYFLMLMVFALPGLIMASILMQRLISPAAGYLLDMLWNLLAACALTIICRNMLHSMES